MIKGTHLRPKIDIPVINVCVASPLISDLQAHATDEGGESDLWKHSKRSFTNDRALDSILVREIVFAFTAGFANNRWPFIRM